MDEASKNWFQTLPGFLTAVAAVLTALTGLLAALSGWFTKDVPHPRARLAYARAISPSLGYAAENKAQS